MKVRGRFYARLLTPLNIVFMGVSVFFIQLAARDLVTTAEHANLTYIYDRLRLTDPRSREIVAKYNEGIERIVANGDCRSDIVNAGLGIILANLDLQNSVADYDAWAVSFERAERYVRYALTCNPGDGNLWARLAMISWATGESSAQLSDLMKQSVARNPSEIGVLRARFVVWRKASAETLRLAGGALESDLNTLLVFGDVSAVKDMLTDSSADLKPYIAAASAKLLPERRDFLKIRGVDLDVFGNVADRAA